MPPLALSDDQMSIIEQMAAPLAPADRPAYLERVAALLADVEIGDGSVTRAAKQAQGELWRAPTLEGRRSGIGKYQR